MILKWKLHCNEYNKCDLIIDYYFYENLLKYRLNTWLISRIVDSYFSLNLNGLNILQNYWICDRRILMHDCVENFHKNRNDIEMKNSLLWIWEMWLDAGLLFFIKFNKISSKYGPYFRNCSFLLLVSSKRIKYLPELVNLWKSHFN